MLPGAPPQDNVPKWLKDLIKFLQSDKIGQYLKTHGPGMGNESQFAGNETTPPVAFPPPNLDKFGAQPNLGQPALPLPDPYAMLRARANPQRGRGTNRAPQPLNMSPYQGSVNNPYLSQRGRGTNRVETPPELSQLYGRKARSITNNRAGAQTGSPGFVRRKLPNRDPMKEWFFQNEKAPDLKKFKKFQEEIFERKYTSPL